MNILYAWKNSLAIFIPKNFKLFMLVTLNAILQTYKVWLKYWGWLLLVYFLVDQNSLIVPILLHFTLYLSMRPSVAQKDFNYFLSYGWHFLYFSFAFLCYRLAQLEAAKLPLGTLLYGLVIYWVFSFSALFLLDSRGFSRSFLGDRARIFFHSCLRAVKMLMYNLPFCLISFLLFFVAVTALMGLYILLPIGNIPDRYVEVLQMFLLPIPLCYITNFYIKKVHEQYKLYFT